MRLGWHSASRISLFLISCCACSLTTAETGPSSLFYQECCISPSLKPGPVLPRSNKTLQAAISATACFLCSCYPAGMSLTVCRSESPIRLDFKRHKADTQASFTIFLAGSQERQDYMSDSETILLHAISDSISFVREDVWTVHDFPAKVDKDFPISPAAYQALKKHWIGTPVKPRDPRVTEKLLRSWGMRFWKQYVLDQYLSNY